MADQNNNNVKEPDINQLMKVRREKLMKLQSPVDEEGNPQDKDPYKVTTVDVTHHAHEIKDHFEELNGSEVTIAGRLMSKRVMGKASFSNIADISDNIQIYVARDDVGADVYKDYKKYDIGDLLAVTGKVFETKTGEKSVHATSITLLAKCLQILPEKYHGLKDTDVRYRQRYIDLIVNEESREVFVKRSRIISSIRRYLDDIGFLEVETPMLTATAGGAAARPFFTHHNATDQDLKLRISLELYLKRLIVGGMEKVYEIGRVFRNEGVDTRHNPEFTLMELYQAYTDYNGMMDLSEHLIRHVAKEVCGTAILPYGEDTIDFEKPFERISMVDAIKKYGPDGIDFNTVTTDEDAKALADKYNLEYEDYHKRGDIINIFFEEYVEDKLIQPTFVLDHPIEISPLTKKKPDLEGHVERFELFVYGRELANAYTELNDPIDQLERFKAQAEKAAAGDQETEDFDRDFVTALEYGMPPTGGIGIGIDRLVMFLTNAQAISDVILFPTKKAKD